MQARLSSLGRRRAAARRPARQRTTKRVRPVRLVEPADPRLVAEHGGVDVHAETWVDGRDRRRLERLCRYVAHPPVATERLTLLPDGRVRVAFKAPWRDGTDAVFLAPLDFLARRSAPAPSYASSSRSSSGVDPTGRPAPLEARDRTARPAGTCYPGSGGASNAAPKGVFIYRSHEEANADRERWTVDAVVERQTSGLVR